MSIFGSIVNKIFGHAGTASTSTQASAGAPQTGGSPGSASSSPSFSPTTASFNNPSTTPAAPGSTTPTAPGSEAGPAGSPAGGGAGHVDVAAVLDGLAAKDSQKLDWRHSIVDMMKLLGLDSSLHARQDLAKELHYSGSMDDSASMNIWLHKQVMQKLADNGGKVPDDLR